MSYVESLGIVTVEGFVDWIVNNRIRNPLFGESTPPGRGMVKPL